MRELKIGILTFHRCINYGSYWQAHCLVKGLRSLGYYPVILDHHSSRINIAEWKCAYRPVLPTAVPDSDHPLYREKITRFFSAFDALPLSPRFPIENPEQMEACDAVVVGSDEVWNLSHPWYARYPIFYGEGLRTRNLISYAASFGNHSPAQQLEPYWAEKLRQFSMLSVRDKNSKEIVKEAIGKEPELVSDPCLLFPIDREEGHGDYQKRRYAAVYGHNFSRSFIKGIRHWARHKGVKLISIGYRNAWADEQWISAGPKDFAQFIAASEAVATNFFHGCVFALRNAKPFVCETSPYRSTKIQCLMQQVGGDPHLMRENTELHRYKTCLNRPLAAGILEKTENIRQNSMSFLERALGSMPLN